MLGHQATGDAVILSEEDRENHIHILGAPGQGKSKLLELLIRGDIQRGVGSCLLDPSENGATARNLLNYCCKIGFEKVVFINPVDFLTTKQFVCLNPIKYRAPTAVSVGNIIDAIRILWQAKDFSDQPRTQRFGTAVLNLLHRTKFTLGDIQYFLSPVYKAQREQIWGKIRDEDFHKSQLVTAYRSFNTFEPIVNRFSVFNDYVLRGMLSSSEGLDFTDLIRDGWLVLVNLDPQSVWGTEQIQQRLLGTLIINEITHAIHRLNSKGWKGVYYLYIDEVGDYATSKLAYILDKKRKTGLRFTVAHQRFEQIEDRNVLSSIRGSANAKVLFFTPNNKDRLMMLQDMGFGGEIPDRDLLYTLRGLEKQSAAISVAQRPPTITRFLDVKDIHNSPAVLKAFKKKLYSNEHYISEANIKQQINARFNKQKSKFSLSRRNPNKGVVDVARFSLSKKQNT